MTGQIIQISDHLSGNAKCSLILPGIISVATLCKDPAEGYPTGNGDAVLVDLQKKIFAVADSPERNTVASRDFLVKFSYMIDSLHFFNSGTDFSDKQVAAIKEELISNTNLLIKDIDYFQSTTFTCLILIPVGNELAGMVLHCGDSCIYMLNINQKKASLLNKADFFFVGRSHHLSQVEFIEIDEGDRFLLCTDGLQNLIKNHNKSFEDIILDTFRDAGDAGEVDHIPDLLIKNSIHPVNNVKLSDDIGVIALNPGNLFNIDSKFRLILGGTTAGQEAGLKKKIHQRVTAEYFCPTDRMKVFPD